GCNDERVLGEPTPSESPAPGDSPTPTPSAAASPTPFVTPTPFATPVPCQFYAIEKDGDLWAIDPSVPSATKIGNTQLQELTDITITADQQVIVIGDHSALLVDPTTAATAPLAPA